MAKGRLAGSYGCRSLVRPPFDLGKVELDAGALAHRALDGDEAPCLLDGAVYGGKAKPRAFAVILGGEEGFHGALEDVRRHPMPRVADAEPHEVAGSRLWVARRAIWVDRDVARFDPQHTAARHRVACVD